MTQTKKTVAIIGGGIAGCTTAYTLATHGYRVNIYERNATIASEASGNPTGLLYPRLNGDPKSSAFALTSYLYSLDFYQALNLKPLSLNFSGLLQLGFNARERARITKVAQWLPTNIAQPMDAAEATQISGIPCEHGALFFPNAAWLQPRMICEALTQHNNISVFTLNNINNLLFKNDLFEIYLDNQCIASADIVIIANADQAQHLLPDAQFETIKVRGQLTQLQASELSKNLRMPICTDGYLIPANNGVHTLGATFSFDPHTDATEAEHQENLEKLKPISEKLFQSLKTQVSGGRVSFRATTPDHLPLVGQLLEAEALKNKPPRPSAAKHKLSWLPNVYVNIGHGSHGFCSAPLAAALITAQITKQTLPMAHDVAATLNPNRFLLKQMGLKKLARMVACDWLEE